MTLINHNENLDFFKDVELTNRSYMVNGSTIVSDLRAKRIERILNVFYQVKEKPYRFSKHTQYLKKQIIGEQKHADWERKRIFMYRE